MSCSITITERFLQMRCSSSAGQFALAHAHAGDGFVEHQQLGVLHQQHADLQPLLLPVRQQARLGVELLAETDLGGHRLDPLLDLVGALGTPARRTRRGRAGTTPPGS
jgi:hypothetical protein